MPGVVGAGAISGTSFPELTKYGLLAGPSGLGRARGGDRVRAAAEGGAGGRRGTEGSAPADSNGIVAM